MSELLLKSQSNKEASILLFKEKYYHSAVHCAYYGCLQYMIHILKTKNSWTDDDIQEKIDLLKEGSHIFYINKINVIINNRNFSSFIGQLKILRVRADYKSEMIEAEDCMKSLDYSESIIRMLKTITI